MLEPTRFVEDRADPQNTQVFTPSHDVDQKSGCLGILCSHRNNIKQQIRMPGEVNMNVIETDLALKQH